MPIASADVGGFWFQEFGRQFHVLALPQQLVQGLNLLVKCRQQGLRVLGVSRTLILHYLLLAYRAPTNTSMGFMDEAIQCVYSQT